MPKLGPIKRRELIKGLKQAGFSGPFALSRVRLENIDLNCARLHFHSAIKKWAGEKNEY